MLDSITERLRGVSFVRTILPLMAIVAIIIAAFIIMTGQPDRSQEEPTISPPKATAAFGNADSVAGSGVVEPSSEVIDIGTSLAGIITKVFVIPGDQVSPGAPLFLVDDRAIRAQIQEAAASIARAKAARDTARALLATARQQSELYSGIEDPRAISKQEVIDRSGAVRTARAQLALAEAEIRSAGAARTRATTDLGRLTVRAPIAAEILSVNIRPGEYANPGGQQGGVGEPYMEIGTTDPLHIRIDIDENEIGRVQLGAEAVVSPRGEANRRIKAQFVRAEPLVTPKTSLTNAATERVDVRVLQLIYRIPSDQGLFVGQQVDAFVRAKTGNGAKAEQSGDPK